MVGHTNQDFLLTETAVGGVDGISVAVDLSVAKEFAHALDFLMFPAAMYGRRRFHFSMNSLMMNQIG